MRFQLKRISKRSVIFFTLGIAFIVLGFVLNNKFSISTKNLEKYETKQSFALELSSNKNVTLGDSINIDVTLADINVSNGDVGVGALTFKLNYDKSAFQLTSITSTAGTISKDDSTNRVIFLVNNANTLKNDTKILTIKLKSLTSFNKASSTVSLTDISGSSGSTVTASSVSTSVTFKETDTAPVINFEQENTNVYKKQHSVKVTVTDNDNNLDNNSLKYVFVPTAITPSNSAISKSFSNGDTINSEDNMSGLFYLWVIASDTAGHTKISHSDALYLDNIAPSCNLTINENVVTLTGNDTYSGLNAGAYSFDDGAFSNVNKKTINSVGSTTVTGKVRDNAGNIATCSKTFNLKEQTDPIINVSPAQTQAVKNQNITITVSKGSNDLASSNQYQYFLSKNIQEDSVPDEVSQYTSGETINIGENMNGIYYLYVKSVEDINNNESENNGDMISISGVNYHRFGPYIFDNTPPICSFKKSTDNYTNKQVTITVSGKDDFIRNPTYSFDGEDYSTVNSKAIDSNGTYHAYVKDDAGNIGSCDPIEINNIDTKAPVVTFDKDGSSIYQTVAKSVVSVVDDKSLVDDSLKYKWTQSTTAPDINSFQESFSNNSEVKKEFSSGTWYLWILAKDKAGNTTITKSESFLLDNISPTVPTISGNAYDGIEINHNAVMTIGESEALSGIKGYEYSFNNGITWLPYEESTGIAISDEGETSIVARAISNTDLKSEQTKPFTVIIKKTPLELNYRSSTLSKTNDDVTITISANKILQQPSGWTLSSDGYSVYKIYDENKEEDIDITSIDGDKSTIKVMVNEIDRDSPKLTTSYKKNENYVEVTITSDEELQELDDWIISQDGKSLTRDYYKNLNTTVTVYDIAGNQGVANIEILSIDEGDFDINVDYEEQIDGSVKVIVSSSSQLKQLSGWDISSDKTTLTKIIKGNINEVITVTDINNAKKNIRIYYLFQEETLSVTEQRSNYEKTNEDVVVTLKSNYTLNEIEGWQLSDDKKGLTKVFSENTEEQLIISSIDGKTTNRTVKITNIDKEKPIIVNCNNNGVYESIKLSFNENLRSITILKDNKLIEYTGKDMILDEEGNYVITLQDDAYNINVYNITIKKSNKLVAVPDTKKNISKTLIVIGLLEIIIGILLITKFKINNKFNLFSILVIIYIINFNRGYSASNSFTLNGYVVKDNLLYNIEATTTPSILKSNLDDDTISIRKSSTDSGASPSTSLSANEKIATGNILYYNKTDYPVIISGDINSDGLVNASDTSALIGHILQKTNISDKYKSKAADYTQNNSIDISDLYQVNKRVVKNNYKISVKGVTVSASSTTLDAGRSRKVTAKVYPTNANNKAVSYSISTGGTYASVDTSGKVTGKQGGKATIMAKTTDQSKSATISFTINNSYKLHVVNLKEGNSMVLESNGHYGMIDTGTAAAYNGQESSSKIKKVLDSLNVKQLDFLIITHNHDDHMGSATQIIDDYKPKTLYIKRYSHQDNVTAAEKEAGNTQAKREQNYQDILKHADNAGSTIKVIGTPVDNKYITDLEKKKNTYNQSKDRSFKLGAFTVKLYSLSNQLANYPCSGETAGENMNSLTQVLSITVNGKKMNTYLESDMSDNSNCKKNGKQIKEVVYGQVTDDFGKIHIYQVGHHGYYNGTNLTEIKQLNPDIVFATASQDIIAGRSQSNRYQSIQAIYDHLGKSSFEKNFKLTGDDEIVVDYTSGTPKMTGGVKWDLKASSSDYHNWRQTDSRWSNVPLGKSNYTIGPYGCFITSIAIQIARSGADTNLVGFDPGSFVLKLNEYSGSFSSSGSFMGVNIDKIVPGFKEVYHGVSLSGSATNKVKQVEKYLNDGYYPIMKVKTTNGQHWVAVLRISTNGKDVVMVDPMSSSQRAFEKYTVGQCSTLNVYKIGN